MNGQVNVRLAAHPQRRQARHQQVRHRQAVQRQRAGAERLRARARCVIAVIAAAAIAAVIVGLVPPPGPAAAAADAGPAQAITSSLAAPMQVAVSEPATANQPDVHNCTQAWPYYEPSCLRNGRRPDGNTRIVRLIDDDRSVADRALRATR